MEKMVSRERSRKARQRQKQAVRNNTPSVHWREHAVIGLSVVLAAWGAIALFMRRLLPLDNIMQAEHLLPAAGDAVFALTAIFITALYLYTSEPTWRRRNSRIILLTLIVLLSTGLGRFMLSLAGPLGLLPSPTANFILPCTLAPLLGTILLGSNAGIATGLATSLLFAIYTGYSLPVLFTGLIATAVICHAPAPIRTRSRVIRIAVTAGLAQVLVVGASAALAWEETQALSALHQAIACLGGGVLSAVIALLILPLLEHVFGITTDISLLEFSDLGHPLLQQLALEAPGTYHHSLVVANIAQAAAEAIGANSLEARVSAYFHDIGKLTKPNFFAENIHLQENPHDNLSPSMSTLIITAHVKEGLSLAMLHKLPEPVKRAIQEHHGTSMLQCFHHKAVSQLELEMGIDGGQATRVDDHNFRYAGPRPSTRVSGIICLADAVEAASRSIEKPTPAHIENMVNDIVRKRLEDGQLDDCELSLLELSKIRKAFVFTLTTMLHGRIAYPKDEAAD